MSIINADIPFEKFVIEVEPPVNRLANMAIYIHEDGKVNLNGKLVSQINHDRIMLLFTENYKNICIKIDVNSPNMIRLPKNGNLKIKSVSDGLEKSGFTFPVQYSCWYSKNYECWQGALFENPMKKPVGKHPSLQKK